MKIAVCDDDGQMLNMVQQTVDTSCVLLHLEAFVYTYKNVEELLTEQRKEDFDVVFLEIMMPQMTGYELAGELKKENGKIRIVYMSCDKELVYDSFIHQPIGFIRKHDFKIMEEDIKKVMKHIAEKIADTTVILKIAKGANEQVDSRDIIYLQSEKNYMKYQLKNGQYMWVRETMTVAERKLESFWFCRINKQVLMNLNHVRKIDFQQKQVYCKNQEIFKIGNSYQEAVLEKYLVFTRQEI